MSTETPRRRAAMAEDALIALPRILGDKVAVRPYGCWEWKASLDSTGYGHVRWGGIVRQAHIVTWELTHGPVADGFQLDHTCHDPSKCGRSLRECLHRRCVNPDHLEEVTQVENVRRGNSVRDCSGICRNGLHAWVGDNILVNPTNGNRQCRACKIATDRARWARRRG